MGEPVHRLSAIVFTDIVGYTSLMGENEETALATLEKNKKIHENYFERYNSTYWKQIGDGYLAVFDSVVQAAHACGFIQKECKTNQINIRIGIHGGEVIFKDNDVYGDEVNIASRIEGATEPGTIYISENVKNNLDNKTGLDTTFVKECALKNVKNKINLYRLSVDTEKIPASPGVRKHDHTLKTKGSKMLRIAAIVVFMGLILFLTYNFDRFNLFQNKSEINLSEKSIAVLPFQNFSNDSSMNYLGDGFADHIIINLSRIPDFKVIARSSSFRFKRSGKPLSEIAKDLGVQNILEGSFQVFNEEIHLNMNLVHASSGEVLFSDSFTGILAELFEFQDDVADQLTGSLIGSFVKFNAPVKKEKEINLQAFKMYQQGQSLLKDNYLYRSACEESRKLFLQANKLDPDWSAPYIGVAESYFLDLHYGWAVLGRVKDSIEYFIEKGSAINEEQGEIYCMKGGIAFWNFEFGEAANFLQKAVSINPNYPYSYFYLSSMESVAGSKVKSIEYIDKAISLDPLNETFRTIKPLRYFNQGQYEEAEKLLLEMLEKKPGENTTLFILGAVYTGMKKYDKALEVLERRSVGQTTNFLNAYNYAKTGQTEKATVILNHLLTLPEEAAPPHMMIALVYLGLEDYDNALAWMKKSLDSNDLWISWINQSWSDPVRDDPRFIEIMESYNNKIKY